jgi:hypothetical protein
MKRSTPQKCFLNGEYMLSRKLHEAGRNEARRQHSYGAQMPSKPTLTITAHY